MRNIIKIVLVITALILSYFIFSSVQTFVDFNDKKIVRYATAAESLQDVANAQRLYLGTNGKYTDNLDSLKYFLDHGRIMTIRRRDSSAYVYDQRRRIDVMRDFTIFDTLYLEGSVRDSVFRGRDAMADFGYVVIEGQRIPIEMYASFSDRVVGGDSTNIQRDHFFKGSVPKRQIFAGLDESLIEREMYLETAPVKDEVISVGSEFRPTLEGNWNNEIDAALRLRRDRRAQAQAIQR
ncbi:MAG: hypothetical protein Q4F57_09110 [Weeksellaceae bacterium]|nr:hypothetical protein [Weeksellaceae bacterium]